MVEEMRRHMASWPAMNPRCSGRSSSARSSPIRSGSGCCELLTSARHAQRFLSAHDQIVDLFHLRRDHLTTGELRAARRRGFEAWADISGVAAAAWLSLGHRRDLPARLRQGQHRDATPAHPGRGNVWRAKGYRREVVAYRLPHGTMRLGSSGSAGGSNTAR